MSSLKMSSSQHCSSSWRSILSWKKTLTTQYRRRPVPSAPKTQRSRTPGHSRSRHGRRCCRWRSNCRMGSNLHEHQLRLQERCSGCYLLPSGQQTSPAAGLKQWKSSVHCVYVGPHPAEQSWLSGVPAGAQQIPRFSRSDACCRIAARRPDAARNPPRHKRAKDRDLMLYI
jgi:hypothetical protein